jgi:hypothetical protein
LLISQRSCVRVNSDTRVCEAVGLGQALSDWDTREGIHHQTASKWFKQGMLPVPARQAASEPA